MLMFMVKWEDTLRWFGQIIYWKNTEDWSARQKNQQNENRCINVLREEWILDTKDGGFPEVTRELKEWGIFLPNLRTGICSLVQLCWPRWHINLFVTSVTLELASFYSLWLDGSLNSGISATGGLFMAKPMRERKYITMMDPFQSRYGNVLSAFLALPALMSDMLWVACTLFSLGKSSVEHSGW